jgi:hypothetical protein
MMNKLYELIDWCKKKVDWFIENMVKGWEQCVERWRSGEMERDFQKYYAEWHMYSGRDFVYWKYRKP